MAVPDSVARSALAITSVCATEVAMTKPIDFREAQDAILRELAERDEVALRGRRFIMRRLEAVERVHFSEAQAAPDAWACIVSRDPRWPNLYVHTVVPWPPGPVPTTDREIADAINVISAQSAETPQDKAREILAAGVLLVTDRERGFLERLSRWRGEVPEWQRTRLAHMWGCHLAELNKGVQP
jgi:hypothetical protein